MIEDRHRPLVQLLQDAFPLVPVPFAELGARLGQPEAEVLAGVAALKDSGMLRQIGAIFDTRRLGYISTLVAAQVQPAALEAVAAAVSRHPGVSHNYSRDHVLNLWFTLAVPPGESLEGNVTSLLQQPGVERYLLLPTVRTFKIRVSLDMGVDEAQEAAQEGQLSAAMPKLLPGKDKRLVRVLQEDLPLEGRPFRALAQAWGMTEEAILEAARRFLREGVMRRYGATLRHQAAGYVVNAMACWQVPGGRLEAAGNAAAALRAVSHCYERRAFPEWPYALYTMIHARSEEDLSALLRQLAQEIRPVACVVLRTVHEYKKVRLRYFDQVP